MEKKTFSVFKFVKYFRPFHLRTHIKVIVPFPAVRQLLVKKELGEKRTKWVTTLQEYGIEVKPTKIVRGQCFCRLITRDFNIC